MARSIGLRSRKGTKAFADKVKIKRNYEFKIENVIVWISTSRMTAEEKMENKREVRCSNQWIK